MEEVTGGGHWRRSLEEAAGGVLLLEEADRGAPQWRSSMDENVLFPRIHQSRCGPSVHPLGEHFS